jgi:hypothetical protein
MRLPVRCGEVFSLRGGGAADTKAVYNLLYFKTYVIKISAHNTQSNKMHYIAHFVRLSVVS